MIKPIETRYANYRFRSRLEARWAVFFDALGIRWQYEPEGYALPSGWYLPDFWLPDLAMYIEIKATDPDPAVLALIDEFDHALYAASSADDAERPTVRILVGSPRYDDRNDRLDYTVRAGSLAHGEVWAYCPMCRRVDLCRVNDDWSPDGIDGEASLYCGYCDCIDRSHSSPPDGVYFHKGDVIIDRGSAWYRTMGRPDTGSKMAAAYRAAMGARFEHGENGAGGRR